MSSRGPDDEGLWISLDERASLAHRRLSIVDLSPAGHQPMWDVKKRAIIVFNGEVYNHAELRGELRSLGHEFMSQTDTEVVLAAYLQWGDECVQRFNGMWAFAIYKPGGHLFLSRDRAGKKPLLYVHDDQGITFASGLDPLLSFSNYNWRISSRGLEQYLGLGYVLGADCIIEPALKLPPAHNALFDTTTGELKIWRYWSLPRFEPEAANTDFATEVSYVTEIATQAVACRLEADVPVGVFLSGGLDSSLVAALAARAKGGGQIRTFTIKMPGSKLDESKYAAIVASHLGTQHTELSAEPSAFQLLPELADHCDEPIADSSLLPSYMLCKLTREHVTVALGGDGGDEIFAGYEHYPKSLRFGRLFGSVPVTLWRKLAAMAEKLPSGFKGRNLFRSLQDGPLLQPLHASAYFDAALRRRLLCASYLEQSPEMLRLSMLDSERSALMRLMVMDFETTLPDDYLVKIDRASMAVSLEVRAPWLDVRLIEHLYRSVPDAMKADTKGGRRLLQKAMADQLLPSVLDTERKQGFSIPLQEWFTDEMTRKMARVWILDSPLKQLVREKFIDNLLHGVASGRSNHGRLYALCMLGLFLERLPESISKF